MKHGRAAIYYDAEMGEWMIDNPFGFDHPRYEEVSQALADTAMLLDDLTMGEDRTGGTLDN